MTDKEKEKQKIISIVQQQRDFFNTGATKDPEVRRTQLAKLRSLIINNEKRICEALFLDLHKSSDESIMTEIQVVLSEIKYHYKHVRKWSQGKRMREHLFTLPGQSHIKYEPYGIVLIIAPWNYPFQLLLNPLVGAISAGNCAILKPSPKAKHTASLLTKLIREYFPERYIAAFDGDDEITQTLLDQKFDYIFFTGGPLFGKYIAQCAAKTLTPVTLELGGKSPCVVGNKADIDLAARRIIWGKMLNAGQTCIAPDYILVHADQKSTLIKKLKKYLLDFFGPDPKISDHYPRIINEEATKRLAELMNSSGQIILGGDVDIENKYIAPTIIDEPSPESQLMREEIFGPIIPIISYNTLDEAISFINKRDKPLALYYFGSQREAHQIAHQTSSGGMCINDTVMHIINRHLPFGGVGQSGIGRYHGRESFKTFSNPRSVLQTSTLVDLRLRYPPYKIPQFFKRFF